MKKWILKAIVQKLISFLPYRERINHLFQKHITKGIVLDDTHLKYKLEHARDHIRFLRQYGTKSNALNILELGTGWYPIIPICYWLEGLGTVTSVDLSAWMTPETQMTAVKRLLDWKDEGRLDDYVQGSPDKWVKLRAIAKGEMPMSKTEDFNALIGLTTWVGDARHLPLDDSTVDFISSNNTFEHIFPEVLHGILVEFQRVLKEDGLMSHFIDMSDHFAHFDTSITHYNFLQFSGDQWQRIDNKIQPQNRWRWKQYRTLYDELGLRILHEEIRAGDLEALAKVKVHTEWSAYSPEELAITHGYLVSG
jgi:hypothetical protein